MPLYSISAPDGNTYQIEGPEGATKEEVVAAILRRNPDAAKPKSVTGYVREAIKGIPRGLVGGLEQAAVGAAALLPEEYEKPVVEKAKALAQRVAPTASLSYAEAPTTKLAEALGSMGTFLVPGGIPARVAMAAAMGAGEARQRAQQAGATPEEISRSTALGIIPGLTDILPVERMVSRFGKGAVEGVVGRVAEVLKTGGLEAAQEAAQGYAQNLIAQNIYKPDQSPEENVAESAALGFGAGAVAQTLLDLVTHGRARLAPARTEPPAPSVLPAPPEGEPPAPSALPAPSEGEPPAPAAAEETAAEETTKEEAAVPSPSVITDDVLNTLGVGKRNTKLRNQLRGLDLSNAEDRGTYDRVFADSKAKFNYEAVDNFIAPYRPEKPRADESISIAPAAVDTETGGRGVGEPVSKQATGEPIVAEPLGGGVAVAGEPARGVAGRKEPSAAPVDLFGPIPTEVLESRKVEDREQALPEPEEAAVSPGQLGFFGPRGGVLKEAIPKTVEPPKAPKAPKAKKEPPSTTKPEIDASLAALDSNISQQEYEAHLDYLVREAAYAEEDKDGLYAKQKLEEAQIPKSDLEAAQQRAARFASREKAANQARVVTELEKLNDQLSEVKHDLKEAAASGEDTADLRDKQDTLKAQIRNVSKEAKDLGISPKAKRVDVRHIRTARKSVGEVGPPTGNSTDRVVKEIERIMRPGSGFERITTVVQTEAGLPEGVREAPDYRPGVRGVAYKGRIWLVADNIPQGRELGVFLHEAGAHLGFDQVMKPGDREHLARTVRNWAKGNDLKAQAAKIALAKGGGSNDEIIAYTVEELVNRGVKPQGIRPENTWLARVKAAFKRAMQKLGLRKDLTAQELVDVAFGAAHIAVKAPGKTQEGPRFSTANPALDAVSDTDFRTFTGPTVTKSIVKDAINTAVGPGGGNVIQKVRQNMASRYTWWEDFLTSIEGNNATDAAGAASAYDRLHASSKVTGIQLSTLEMGGFGKASNGMWEAQKTDASFKDVISEVNKMVGKYKRTPDFESAQAFFNMAAIAKREEGLIQSGKIASGDVKRTISDAQLKQGLDIYNRTPEIQKALQVYEKFNNRNVDSMVTAGLIDAQTAKDLKGAAGYVPWFRFTEDKNGNINIKAVKDYAKGLINLSSMRDLEGGKIEDVQINNILDNMARLSNWMVSKSIGNDTAEYMTRYALKYKQARKVGAPDAAGVDPRKVVQILRNGTPEFYEFTDPMALPAFKGYETAHGAMVSALAAPANLLRKGVTLYPVFALGQLPQDSLRAFVFSGLKNPFAIFPRVLANFIKEAFGGSETSKRLAQYGIVGRAMDVPRDEITKHFRKELGLDKAGFSAGLGLLEKISNASDAAIRTTLYELTMKEGGSEALALRRARDIINFDIQGSSSYASFLRQTVPFMGVYMNDLNNLYKGLVLGQGRLSEGEIGATRRAILYRGMQLGALTMLYTLLVGDDDDYKNLDDSTRNRSFVIPGSNLRIPVPGDGIGFMFKVVPEQIARYMLAEGIESEDAGARTGRAVLAGFSNLGSFENFLPLAARIPIELTLNRSFYTQNPIVGKSKERLEPYEQFTDSTGEIAKQLGLALNVSPIKLEYILRGFSGQLGGSVYAMTNALMNAANNKTTPSLRLEDYPGLKAFTYSSADKADLENYYEMRDDVDRVARTYRDFIQAGRGQEAIEYMADPDNQRTMALRKYTTQVDGVLQKFRQQRKLIFANENLSADQMREKLDQLDAMQTRFLQSLQLPRARAMAGVTPDINDWAVMRMFR